MQHLGRYIGIAKQTEVLILALIGIICTICDASILDLHSNLYKVWEIRMDPAKFSDRTELYMKYLLSTVVLIRTFSVHLYLGCYIILLYPAVFEEKPSLILPWLVTSAVKCLLAALIAFSAGFYTCMAYSFTQPTCWEFLISQAVDHIPSIYVFFLVLSYYRDLKQITVLARYVRATINEANMDSRRRKSRYTTDALNPEGTSGELSTLIHALGSASNIEDILLHIQTDKRRSLSTRSLDTLLAQMKEDEARDEILNVYDEAFDADQTLTVKERTTRLLNLTDDDIRNAMTERTNRRDDILKVFKSLTSVSSMDVENIKSKPFSGSKSEMLVIQSETELRQVFPENEKPVISSPTKTTGRRRYIEESDAQLQTNTQEIKMTAPMYVKDPVPEIEFVELPRYDVSADNSGPSKKRSMLRTNFPKTEVNTKMLTSTSKVEGQLTKKESKSNGLHRSNRGSRTSYKEDGYTQAYTASLLKKKKK